MVKKDTQRKKKKSLLIQQSATDQRPLKPGDAATAELKNAEETLRRSDERYRTLFNSIDDGLCVVEMLYDSNGKPHDYRFLEVNPSFEQQTGLIDAIGKTTKELVPNLDSWWIKTYGKVADTGKSIRFENDAAAMNRWFDVYAFRLGGRESKKVAIFFKDITERKQAEDTKSWLAAIVDSSNDGIVSFTLDGVILSWNRGAEIIFGYTEEEIVGQSALLLVSTELKAEQQEMFAAVRAGKHIQRFETNRLRKGGLPVEVSLTMSPIKGGGGTTLGVTAIIRDITERKFTQRLLEESKDRYSAFIAQSSEGIYRFELEKPISVKLPHRKQIGLLYEYVYVAECNDAMAKMYGYKEASDLIGARLGDFMPKHEEASYKYIDSLIQGGYRSIESVSVEVDKDGRQKYFLNNLIGVVKDGFLVRVWGMQRDITRQKNAERQKDEFMGIVTHELKTPVTSIKAFTQVLEHRFRQKGDAESANLLLKMDVQLGKLTSLISDLLDVTKIEEGEMQFHNSFYDMDTLVREIVEEVQRTTDKHAIIIRGHVGKKITGDRERTGQVLTNLLTNAIKYSPNSEKIIVHASAQAKSITLCVQDFGIGIPKELHDHIFKRFFRVSGAKRATYPGLGLGLYIASNIVHREGGTITLTSEKGKGSRFYVRLPLKALKKK